MIQDKEQLELFEYEAFVDKFKPKKTTDDCYTPENIYNAVRDWVCNRYGIDPAAVIRPFWPGADFTRTEYPDGCAVIDNPPFSITSKIVIWYQQRGIRFFLFTNGLTAMHHIPKGITAICVGVSLIFENGANINCSFLTNMEPEIAAMSCPELYQILDRINEQNRKIGKKQVRKITLPDEVITAAKLNWYSIHNTPFTIRRADSLLIDNIGTYKIFGDGLLLSERAAAERIPLTDREKQLQRMIGGQNEVTEE